VTVRVRTLKRKDKKVEEEEKEQKGRSTRVIGKGKRRRSGVVIKGKDE
jgi:hypothetical protein